jgi:iron complex transport system substrate-binding protein
VLAFADPARIASLSVFAAQPAYSARAAEAARYPRNDGSGERLLMERPDLTLAGRYDPRARIDLLRRHGLAVALVEPWTSFDHGRAQIRAMAEALGAPARGESLVAALDAALGRLDGAAARPATVLRVHRRLYVEGGRSWIGEMIARAGLVDLAATGRARTGLLTVEDVIAAAPDFLIVAEADGAGGDLGAALLGHPALARLYPPAKRIALPASAGVCEGPSTPDFIDAFAQAVRAATR